MAWVVPGFQVGQLLWGGKRLSWSRLPAPVCIYVGKKQVSQDGVVMLSRPTCSCSCPCFVNNDYVTAETTYSAARVIWDTCLVTGYFCSVSIYKFHLESPEDVILGEVSYERSCYVCCYACLASPKKINMPAVPIQLPCSHLAYPGFREQGAQWDTARQLA